MSELSKEACSACRPDAPRVEAEEARTLLQQIPEWSRVTRDDVPRLEREYRFKNFVQAQAFCLAVGEMAETMQHHPDISYGWGYARIHWYTHKINGLHRNDFVCAAKTDQLFLNDQGA